MAINIAWTNQNTECDQLNKQSTGYDHFDYFDKSQSSNHGNDHIILRSMLVVTVLFHHWLSTMSTQLQVKWLTASDLMYLFVLREIKNCSTFSDHSRHHKLQTNLAKVAYLECQSMFYDWWLDGNCWECKHNAAKTGHVSYHRKMFSGPPEPRDNDDVSNMPLKNGDSS